MLNFLRRRAIQKRVEYLKEMRPLPLGRKEFEAWSKEIIKLAEVPGLTEESGQFALSEMILHVKPTQSFESYAHFVHSLRKGAANQVAHAIFQEIKQRQQEIKLRQIERIKEQEAQKQKEVIPELGKPSDEKVLEDHKIQSS